MTIGKNLTSHTKWITSKKKYGVQSGNCNLLKENTLEIFYRFLGKVYKYSNLKPLFKLFFCSEWYF